MVNNKLEQHINSDPGEKRKFNKRFFLVLIIPWIITIVIFISELMGLSASSGWVNHLFFWLFIPSLFASLILSHRWSLIGGFGDVILLLMPTFIWLLPGHAMAILFLIIAGFGIFVSGLVFYLVAIFLQYTNLSKKNPAKCRMLTLMFYRLAFISASLLSTLVASVILIHWGDTMGFAEKIANGIASIDYTNVKWITFIAVVTILVALLLVGLGLLSLFTVSLNDSEILRLGKELDEGAYPSSKKKVNLEKTRMIIVTKKSRRKQRKKYGKN